MTSIKTAHAAKAVSPIRRSFRATLLLVAALAGSAAWSCANGSGSHAGGGTGVETNDSGTGIGFGGGDASAPTIQGLVSIAITPATTSLSLAYPVTFPGATAQLTAEGKFQDGHSADVSSSVTWTISPGDIASVGGGAFSSQAPGTVTITALAGSIVSSPATVTVTVTGTVVGMGVTQGDLDGTPSGAAPTIAYPLDGALFPFQLGPIEFQVVPTSAAQTEARIAFESPNIDLKVYEPCVPITTPTIPNACAITVPSDLEPLLDGASEAGKLAETVRLAAPGGGSLGESAPIGARWSSSALSGGLYYWSADILTGNTLIMRYDLDTPGTPPEQYFTQTSTDGGLSDEQNMDPPASNGSTQCFGCHAISLDGTKIGLAFGGSAPALFALIDVATKTTIATRLFSTDPNAGAPFAAFTTFSPDGTTMIQAVQSKLWLRTADATLADINSSAMFGGQLGSDVASIPFWSPKGDLLAFTGWVPCVSCEMGIANDTNDTNGDETPNAEIWTASVTGNTTFGTPTKLVPTVSGKSEYYPAISDDSQYVVFDESSCDGPGPPSGEMYGLSPCDGYDDASATIRLVSAQGGQPVYLTNASQNDNWSNSWPRFAPTHGTFQGNTLYWIAFSSRHPYGATLPGTNNPPAGDTEPQLWFSAVVVDSSGTLSADPSFAPVWLPQQNPGGTQRGNHSPQWVTKAVPVQIP
jgi:hypothetical protein